MGLPSHEQLRELAVLIEKERPKEGLLSKTGRKGVKVLEKAALSAVGSAVNKGLTSAGVQSGLHIGVSLGGMSSAVSAWTSAALVAVQASKVFSLYDILDDAQGARSRKMAYECRCGECAKNIKYIIEKKERNVAIVGLGVATLGAVSIGKTIHSIGKKLFFSSEPRPKQLVSEGIVRSAKGGCTTAMATVFLLAGSWRQGYRDKDTMVTAVKTLTEAEGWERFKSSW